MTTTQSTPPLRFPGFSEEWNRKTLKHVVKINQGLQIPISDRLTEPKEDAYFYITNQFLKQGSSKKYYIMNPPSSVICDKDDILMTRTGNTGIAVTNVKGAFHNNFFKIAYPKYIEKYFLFTFLGLYNIKNMILRYAGTSTIPDLNHSDFYRLVFCYPNYKEQQKIAAFLSSVDTKIEQLGKKKASLEQYKKGMMQKLFSQEIRFKDEQGNSYPAWNEKPLSDLFHRVATKNKIDNKNVLTISAQMGLVNQTDYFNHSVAAKDLTGYYLLEKGDFAYNKSYSKGYPMGAIKRLTKFDIGVVSTLYICFRAVDDTTQIFFEKLFDSGYQNRWIHKIAQEGARNHGLLNMAIGDFFNIPLPLPCKAEQQKIANFLSVVDQKLELVGSELETAQAFKKGLLQKMFI